MAESILKPFLHKIEETKVQILVLMMLILGKQRIWRQTYGTKETGFHCE